MGLFNNISVIVMLILVCDMDLPKSATPTMSQLLWPMACLPFLASGNAWLMFVDLSLRT